MGLQPLARTAAAGALVLVGVAACTGGVAPSRWADQVCGALIPWRTTVAQLNGEAQQKVAAATTPAQTRDGLVELLSGAQTASETARAAVVAAGTPDVDGGADVANRIAASLAGTRDAYAKAKADLLALPTDDPTSFYRRVATIMDTLQREYAASAVDTNQLNSVELSDAFDKVDRCR
jgi:hypothetical protein